MKRAGRCKFHSPQPYPGRKGPADGGTCPSHGKSREPAATAHRKVFRVNPKRTGKMTLFLVATAWAGQHAAAQEQCSCQVVDIPACDSPGDGHVSLVDIVICTQAATGAYDPEGPSGSCPNASAIFQACDIDCSGTVDMCDVGQMHGWLFEGRQPCTTPCGTCCHSDPAGCCELLPPCFVSSRGICEGPATVTRDGVYQGDGTTCSPSPCDCQPNGTPDGQDIAAQTSVDINGNGNPDECELGGCCLELEAGTCAAGPLLGQPCQTDQQCQGSTCSPVSTAACGLLRQSECEDPARNGTYLGPGGWCPEQNVGFVREGDGTVFVHVIGPPVGCHAPGATAISPSRGDCSGPPFSDYWVSSSSGSMCQDFGSPDTVPIPADFFGAGSDPFDGLLCLKGAPLGRPGAGDSDTQIQRMADPFDRCALPSATPSTVDIEIVALSLASVTPITVTYSGGGSPEEWDVAVDLAPAGLLPGTPQSTLTAVKTNCNGGTYMSELYVQPRFTFTQVGDPTEVRVLDTHQEGRDPIRLVQSASAPWVAEIDPELAASVDPCSQFHAGIDTMPKVTNCDCNGNSMWDRCDIEQQMSADCNSNLRPDSCDIDDGTFADENGNGVLDLCEGAPIPAASTWGLMVMGVSVLAAGTVRLRRRALEREPGVNHIWQTRRE